MLRFHPLRFNDVALLRSIEPSRLLVFLQRFDHYLHSQGFEIPEEPNLSDAQLRALVEIFHSNDGSTPAEMMEALFHISELADDSGMEDLLVLASKRCIELPDGDLSPADLALAVWLQDPDLLRRANCQRVVQRFQSFYCYMNRTLEAPLFEMPTEPTLRRIEGEIDDFNLSRRRCGGAAVWMYEFGNEVAFLIRYGGSIQRDEVMDNDLCRPDIRRPVSYDLVVYNIDSGELRIRADLVSERKFYCQLFSQQLFRDPTFFEHGETFDLEAIYRLGPDIQSPGMVPGIRKIVLLEIQEVIFGERVLHITLRSDAIFEAIAEHNRQLTPTGRLHSAKFRISLESNDEVTVTICSGNKIRLSRQVGVSAIDQWMLHHGMRVPNHATAHLQKPSPLANHLSHPKRKSPKVSVASRIG
ncbi:hypothetical protein VN12_24375 [Pirellula sp. SH-Sr6A]|uniref:hypothetical protein n=1 Tax=Pirellula sp. SH-Sr6A TaxID=1632865 RepID=UPI00078D440F|nr:hypothetical protein [Pirellula sp. SH-Sr6A]AMV35284.1 hypothetical protein VN12_24375 [Pirellula sp. SH-Sr6A]